MADHILVAAVLHGICAAAYLTLAVGVMAPALRRGHRPPATAMMLAAASVATAAWGAAAALTGARLAGPAAAFDLIRMLLGYAFALHLLRAAAPFVPRDAAATSVVPDRLRLLFTSLGGVLALAVGAAIVAGAASAAGCGDDRHPGLALRLALALSQLLLIENLYRNTERDLRWNVTLACLGLGGIAVFDLALCADATLFGAAYPGLVNGRPAVALLVVPLLAMTALRNRFWALPMRVSRGVALHTASLAASGLFLLAVAGAGALAMRLGPASGGAWRSVAWVSLLFAVVLAGAMLATSASARGIIRFALIDHLFSRRFDYRQEWLRCIDTLSTDTLHNPLEGRVVRAIARVLDSPAGMLLRDPGELGLHWADSWNMPPLAAPLGPEHPLLARLDGEGAACALPSPLAGWAPLDGAGPLWLAVPLRQGDALVGCVLAAPSRAPFRLDREVLDLLRIVAREVATHLAEQHATRVLMETRELRAYGERFAFVAHDIKNVSSQLSLLLSNAETHLANPDFQRDMLRTVGASVDKIGALIRRLQTPDAGAATTAMPVTTRAGEPSVFAALERLRPLAERARALHHGAVTLDHDGGAGLAAMDPSVFDTIVTHVLDNAIEATADDRPVRLVLRDEAGRAVLDIIDHGCGMTPAFVRDQLFSPFRTSKRQGSGIGAFQARALLRQAGGDLLVQSEPGIGTTMRLLLPRRRPRPGVAPSPAASPEAGRGAG